MITAAKTASQLVTHAAIAFGLMYGMTGSVAFGGLAAIIEPVINVLLLPLHERGWQALKRRRSTRPRLALAAEKLSQTMLHMGVGFGVMYVATGSLASSGMMALLEPVLNVIVLPFHDGVWARIRTRVAASTRHAWVAA